MEYIKNQIDLFEARDFSIKENWREPTRIFLWCAGIGFFGTFFLNWMTNVTGSDYFSLAIQEGISPKFWNISGALGTIILGPAIIFCSVNFFAYAAQRILISTFSLGALAYGSLISTFVTILPEMQQQLNALQYWILLLLIAYLFICLLFLHFSVWYMSHLSRPGGKFMQKLRIIHWPFRTTAGAFISALMGTLLWLS